MDRRYKIVLTPLSDEDGGGWLAEIPDLPGCMSDGDTPEEALAEVKDAMEVWLAARAETGRPIPDPH